MKTNTKFLFLILMMGMSLISFSQDFSKIKLDPEKVKKFEPFVAVRHTSIDQTFDAWKAANKYQYVKEMWYFSESFYIKRNVNAEGTTMNEAMIDITRFDQNRKASEETEISLNGFKDILVLLPTDKLLYNYKP